LVLVELQVNVLLEILASAQLPHLQLQDSLHQQTVELHHLMR
jgi:hypothetical protein